MVDRLPVVEVVQRHRIALRTAAGRQRGIDGDQALKGLFQVRGGEHGRGLGAAGAGAVAVGPDFVVPVADASVGGDIGLEFHRHCRAKGRPAQFVLARPLHLHRLAWHGARQQHRVVGDVVRGVVAVATRTLDVSHDDTLGRARERHGKVGAQVVNALAVRPHFHGFDIPFCDGAGRADGGVGEEGARVGRGEGFRRRGRRGLRFFLGDQRGLYRL